VATPTIPSTNAELEEMLADPAKAALIAESPKALADFITGLRQQAAG
jgi:hypothetical protein